MKQKILVIISTLTSFVLVILVGIFSNGTTSVIFGGNNSTKVVSRPQGDTAQSSSDSADEDDNVSKVQSTHIISLSGDVQNPDFDAEYFTKQIYELKYLFGVGSFDSPNDISVSILVQYSFCHLFYDSLTDRPKTEEMVYRQAVESSINEQIQKSFNITGKDIKASDLYSSEKNIFEMWEPDYVNFVFADTVCTKLSDAEYRLEATFYSDSNKQLPKDSVVAEFSKNDETYSFTTMNTK